MRKTLVATGSSMLVCAFFAVTAGAGGGTPSSGASAGGGGGSHGGTTGTAHVFAAIAANGAAGAGGARRSAAAAHGVTFTTGTVNGQEAKIALVTLTRPLSPAEKSALHQLGYDEVRHEGLTYYCSSAFSKGGYTGNICFMTSILRQPPR